MSLSISTVFDFSCPYCYLAWGYIRQLQRTVPFVAEWMTWEIHPDVPLEGRNIDQIVLDVNLEERKLKLNTLGRPVQLAPGNKVFVPNTKLALEAVEFARGHHKLQEWVDAVFQASFADNKNIGDQTVLLALAEKIGLDVVKLRRALENGQYSSILLEHDQACAQRQVEWVPTIFVGSDKIIEGAFTFESFAEVIQGRITVEK